MKAFCIQITAQFMPSQESTFHLKTTLQSLMIKQGTTIYKETHQKYASILFSGNMRVWINRRFFVFSTVIIDFPIALQFLHQQLVFKDRKTMRNNI